MLLLPSALLGKWPENCIPLSMLAICLVSSLSLPSYLSTKGQSPNTRSCPLGPTLWSVDAQPMRLSWYFTRALTIVLRSVASSVPGSQPKVSVSMQSSMATLYLVVRWWTHRPRLVAIPVLTHLAWSLLDGNDALRPPLLATNAAPQGPSGVSS